MSDEQCHVHSHSTSLYLSLGHHSKVCFRADLVHYQISRDRNTHMAQKLQALLYATHTVQGEQASWQSHSSQTGTPHRRIEQELVQQTARDISILIAPISPINPLFLKIPPESAGQMMYKIQPVCQNCPPSPFLKGTLMQAWDI